MYSIHRIVRGIMWKVAYRYRIYFCFCCCINKRKTKKKTGKKKRHKSMCFGLPTIKPTQISHLPASSCNFSDLLQQAIAQIKPFLPKQKQGNHEGFVLDP